MITKGNISRRKWRGSIGLGIQEFGAIGIRTCIAQRHQLLEGRFIGIPRQYVLHAVVTVCSCGMWVSWLDSTLIDGWQDCSFLWLFYPGDSWQILQLIAVIFCHKVYSISVPLWNARLRGSVGSISGNPAFMRICQNILFT